MRCSRLLFGLIGCFLLVGGSTMRLRAFDRFDLTSHLKITSMTEAAPPQIVGESILFSFLADHPVRHVGVAFGHESFVRVRNLSRTTNDLFVLTYRPDSGTDEIFYRFVVDGLWITDPNNQDMVIDSNGAKLSRFSFPGAFPVSPASPVVSPEGKIGLYYYGESGKRVYLTGDFANWEPFLYQLEEYAPGAYRFLLPMPPGVHRYHFIVDGATTIDRLNPITAVRGDGRTVSVLVVR